MQRYGTAGLLRGEATRRSPDLEYAVAIGAACFFRALTGTVRLAPCPFLTSLPDGVMVAQATLTRLVMVRIHVGQPFDALRLLMACGRQDPVTASSLIL